MKPIKRDKTFEKNFKKRISLDKRKRLLFTKRLQLFMRGERGYPLNDHPLSGRLLGKRAFSITSDIRVIYIETHQSIIFLDIGTHNQVY